MRENKVPRYLIALKIFVVAAWSITSNVSIAYAEVTTFTLSGKVKGSTANKYAYLVYVSPDGSLSADSAQIENSKFTINYKLDRPRIAFFTIAEKDAYREPLEKGNYKNLLLYMTNYSCQVGNLDKIADAKFVDKYGVQKDYEEYVALTQKANSHVAVIDTASKVIKAKNSRFSLALLYILAQNKIVSSKVAQNIFDGLQGGVKKSELGAITEREIADVRRAEELDPVAIGKQAPDISIPGVDGRLISLKQFRGKWVLLDVWASWCMPCRMENPNVVKAFNAFKDKNFTIWGVSIDQSEEAWKQAIIADKLNWPQSSDLKGWKSDVIKRYNIKGVPANFLISPQGEIVARDIRGPELAKVLEFFLNQ